jgi:hypothetical protein
MKTLESLSEERNGYFTWESLAALFTERTGKSVSCTTVSIAGEFSEIDRLADFLRPRLPISQLSRISINIKRSSPPLGDARERARRARARKRW